MTYYYGGIRDFIYFLESMGIMDIIIPFLLIFTILYAVLQKSKVLGVDENDRPKKNFNLIIALLMAFSVVVPHVTGGFYGISYVPQYDVVNIINGALPQVSLVAVAIIMLFLLLGVWRGPYDVAENTFLSSFAIFFSIAAVVIIFLSSSGVFGANWPYWLYFLRDYHLRSMIMIILIFGLVVYFIVREPSTGEPKDKGLAKMLKDINKGWK